MKKTTFMLLCGLLAFITSSAKADDDSWWSTWKENVAKTWDSDKYELIVPVNTYHVRASYSQKHIEEYNEMPWGLGLNKYYIDKYGNTHGLYAVAFSDSWKKVEPIVGYSWQKNWYLDNDRNWVFGLGYSALITARSNNGYIPFPGVVPIAALEYRNLSVQTGWVPYMGSNDGNVFLTMLKWKI